jgi:hypothetical protein
VERIAIEAYQHNAQANGEMAENAQQQQSHEKHKGHSRRNSRSKGIGNFSPSHHSAATTKQLHQQQQQHPSPMLQKLATDNFAGGAGNCSETISWKAAIFKVTILDN